MAKEGGLGENSRWSLGGMTALVTGGSKGIGSVPIVNLDSHFLCSFIVLSCLVMEELTPFVCVMNREAVVEELAMLGAKVHTCARDETQLQERLREWQAKGFQVTTSVCDVSSRDQRVKLMETVSSLYQGKLNILVSIHI